MSTDMLDLEFINSRSLYLYLIIDNDLKMVYVCVLSTVYRVLDLKSSASLV